MIELVINTWPSGLRSETKNLWKPGPDAVRIVEFCRPFFRLETTYQITQYFKTQYGRHESSCNFL